MKRVLFLLWFITISLFGANSEKVIFDNFNGSGVSNNPTITTKFTITAPTTITYIHNYHWNNGAGSGLKNSTISLVDSSGKTTLTCTTEGSTDSVDRNAPYRFHVCKTNTLLQPGTYTVVDADNATWSWDSQSVSGFSYIKGIEQAAATTSTSATTAAVSTVAGSGAQGSSDGAGTTAGFYRPQGVTVDASGNIFVSDS